MTDWIQPVAGGIYVDATLGGGGHARLFLERMEGKGRLIGFDQDPHAIEAACFALAPFGDMLTPVYRNFRHLDEELNKLGISEVDGILFDLGVSSPQFDEGSRGFSYRQDAPLDMRMDPAQMTSAFHLVNGLTATELADVIRRYGEERWADRIAQFIVQERQEQRIETTGDLVRVIKKAIPAGARREGGHPARRTFQALRIAVNDELNSLQEGLRGAIDHLRPGGRIAVISFHSLEDRIVKQFFRDEEKGCICPPRAPVCQCGKEPRLKVLTRRGLRPAREEVEQNPRSRSAVLRVAERV